MSCSIWQTINKPVIGLSPMDGITDTAFRAVVDYIGHPDVLYTEFISADGLVRNKDLLQMANSHETTTPLIGQLFGKDPIAMQEAAAMLIEQSSVSGIDINMGCPNRRVVGHGGGAGLIKTPNLAKEIILSVKKAVKMAKRPIGLSLKTRIGYDSVQTIPWISTLLEAKPEVIAVHGRTLIQMYSGKADWNEIGLAVQLAQKTNTQVLGNGDIDTHEDALLKIKQFSPYGVLIGRASYGNPWIFTTDIPTRIDRIDAAILHCKLFLRYMSSHNPLSLRKHLGWYIKGFTNARELRIQIMNLQTVKEALLLFEHIRKQQTSP